MTVRVARSFAVAAVIAAGAVRSGLGRPGERPSSRRRSRRDRRLACGLARDSADRAAAEHADERSSHEARRCLGSDQLRSRLQRRRLLLPEHGAAVVVLEWTRPTPGHFPRRPRRFTSKTLPVRPPPAIECFDGPGELPSSRITGGASRLSSWSVGTRDLDWPEPLAVLNTLRVTKRQP
jgi:hypothetical protein